MQIGVHAGALMIMGAPLEDVVAHAVEAEADGFGTYWLPQSGATDALTLIAVLGGLAAKGDIGPVIDRTYALDDIVDAHRYVDTGHKRGNVVLTVP